MKVFILVALLVNILSSVKGSDYVYNYNVENNVVSSQMVYRKNDDKRFISPILKYNFTYDDQQRIVKKEVLRWDAQNNVWINSHCLIWTFTSNGFTIEYISWNKGKKEYTDIKEKQVVTALDGGSLDISILKWSQHDNNWMLKNNMQTFSSPNIYSSIEKSYNIPVREGND